MLRFYFFIIDILRNKRICFINSPQQLINLNELFFIEGKRIKTFILIGYPSNSSVHQIKLLISEINFNYKIIFLSDQFKEKYFRILINIIKPILFFKETIIGDLNYYLSKGFYKYSSRTTFLDDGINLLSLEKSNTKKKYTFYSTLNNKNLQKRWIANQYVYLKKNISQLIRENQIYILGTSDPNYNLFEKKYYEELINDVCLKNYDKKIIFIPHRNEPVENLYKLNIPNLVINKIYYPIEYYLTKIQIIPKTFYGFYTSALNNLRVLLKDLPIKIININFDLKKINNPEVYKLYMNYQSLFDELKIEQFYKN